MEISNKLNPPILSLGKVWYDVFYSRITNSLGYSKEGDEKARDELSHLLCMKRAQNPSKLYEKLMQQIKHKNIIMFGAGPSLKEDIMKLYPVARKKKNIAVAADGATDALLSANIIPSITVSDLDSCSLQALKAQSEGRALFVHGHGDNIEVIRKTLPRLGRNVIGTTQVASCYNVWNFGGLTDGDRACFIASTFAPKMIVIAGMDFGKTEGEFSKSRGSNSKDKKEEQSRLAKKEVKLRFGKDSLEFLIQRKKEIRFVNATTHGEEIRGAEKLPLLNLIEVLS